MKQFCKRAVAVILTVMMVLSLSTVALAAANNQEYDHNTSGTEKLITGYTASGTEGGVLSLEAALKATERVDGKFVIVNYTFTGVQDNAFNRDSNTVNTLAKEFIGTVKELIVADGIKDIGVSAFANMPALEKVTFKGDAVLGEEAFSNCPNLKLITFEQNAEIGDKAFTGCPGVTEVIFNGEAAVGNEAFVGCTQLKKLAFPQDAVIGDEAFAGCTGLTEAVFDGDATVGSRAFRGCTELEKIAFAGNVDLKDEAMMATEGLEDIVFNDDAEITGFQNLDGSAYYKKFTVDFIMRGSTLVYYKGNDEFVSIPENVTEIGPSAFEGNKFLRKVFISKFVDTLGDKAFKDCVNLESVGFATFGSIQNIGDQVFTNTKYYNDFDGDFFTIGSVLVKFRGEGENMNVTIPNTITAITDDCFDGCFYSLDKGGYTWTVSSIFVPASVRTVGEHSFALAQLEDGTYYTPRIYAYIDTDAYYALGNANIDVTPCPVLADVDGNGMVEPQDARRALRMAVQLDYFTNPVFAHAADVNGDHQITPADARTILRLSIELENYTPEELLYMPMTKQEILMYYASVTDIAYRFNVGYTKTMSNTITGSNMNTLTAANFYNVLGKKGGVNETVTYKADTKKALENFDVCTLMSDRHIESASCVLGDDGRYTLDIKFEKVLDNYDLSGMSKALPAKTRAYFASSFLNKSWWNGTKESNSLTKLDLTYTDCAIHAIISRKDYKIMSSDLTIGYHFDLSGRINGLTVGPKLFSSGNATLDRVEKVNYSQFNYTPILDDRQ